MAILLGIDGGGTKTRCLVANETGTVIGEGLSGPSNCQAVGIPTAAANVREAAEKALLAAGLTLADVTAVVAGLAGVGRPEDQAAMTEALDCFGQAHLQVVPDARIALAGALGGGPGAVVISGTGSIAYGLNARGETVRAGGWGWILGDEGSGYDIGRRAVSAALGALDGTGQPTTLGARLCEVWQLERLDLAVRRVYADPIAAKADMAALVPMVITAADHGDTVARGILERAGAELAAVAAAVLRRLELPAGTPEQVAITGGVLTGCEQVRETMRVVLDRMAPGARLIDPIEPPAEGAVRMALALAGTGR